MTEDALNALHKQASKHVQYEVHIIGKYGVNLTTTERDKIKNMLYPTVFARTSAD